MGDGTNLQEILVLTHVPSAPQTSQATFTCLSQFLRSQPASFSPHKQNLTCYFLQHRRWLWLITNGLDQGLFHLFFGRIQLFSAFDFSDHRIHVYQQDKEVLAGIIIFRPLVVRLDHWQQLTQNTGHFWLANSLKNRRKTMPDCPRSAHQTSDILPPASASYYFS